jgi:type III restriction enzyme
MTKFNFEKNLDHQLKAVDAVLSEFKEALITKNQENEFHQHFTNPLIHLNPPPNPKNILDIMMETGTGKTYTYTKTIFELNRN